MTPHAVPFRPSPRLITGLALLLIALSAWGVGSVIWRARHGGDAAVHQGRTAMPYHQW
jgi:hypothetical protein